MIDFTALEAPFPAEEILWRPGKPIIDESCKPLAYLDARLVMERLDAVAGKEFWSCRYPHATTEKTVCDIGLFVNVGGLQQWVWKADGAGDTDIEGEKGSLSDAFKRAAVRWGIGRYLYKVKAPWIKLQKGKDGKLFIPDLERERLMHLLDPTKGITVHGPTGANKTVTGFWAQSSLLIFPKLPKALKNREGEPEWGNPETIAKISDVLHSAIEKAPTKELLNRLYRENLEWMKAYLLPPDLQAFTEAFDVRSQQF